MGLLAPLLHLVRGLDVPLAPAGLDHAGVGTEFAREDTGVDFGSVVSELPECGPLAGAAGPRLNFVYIVHEVISGPLTFTFS
jgi:hypothetical protein